MENDLLVDQSLHPMFGNGKSKPKATGKRRKRAEWMEKNHRKWLECFSWKSLAIHRLRCRVKSIAEEARLMRKEENRASLMYSEILRQHRIDELREDARYSQLALAFVRGRPYLDVEGNCKKGVLIFWLAKEIRQHAPHLFVNLENEIFKWLKGKQS